MSDRGIGWRPRSKPTKAAARAHFRATLTALKSQRSALSGAIAENLQSALANASGLWAAFRALPEEPDVFSALPRRTGLRWAFPLVVGDDLQFLVPRAWEAAAFARGAWGVAEPVRDGAQSVEASAFDGFLVPGLAFDRTGGRLGRGKGYYDRFLSKARGFRMGVAFGAQVSENPLPTEAHDARMDAVVTEEGIIWMGERRL